jgi:hypothetical protein
MSKSNNNVHDVMRAALTEAQRRVGGQDGEGLRALASVCVQTDKTISHPARKKKKPNAPVMDDGISD